MFTKLVESKEDANAQYQAGISYKDERNFALAEECFQKAAEQGHADAQYELGWLSEISMNRQEIALNWYKKAAEQNNSKAQRRLGYWYDPEHEYKANIIERNPFISTYWTRRAVEQNDPTAMRELATRYMLEDSGTITNEVLPMKLLSKGLKTSPYGYFDFYTRNVLKMFLEDEVNKIQTPLSFRNACFLFYTSITIKIMEEEGLAIECETKRKKERRVAVMGGHKQNPYPEMIAPIKDNVLAGLKRLFREQRDLLDSLVYQNFHDIDKIISWFPDQAEEIKRRYAELQTEWTNAIVTHFPSDLVSLFSGYVGQPRFRLAIEIFDELLTSLREKLYAFKEKPESKEAEQSTKLLTLLEPFEKMMTSPLSSRDMTAELANLAELLEMSKKDLFTTSSLTLFKESSAILKVLEEASLTLSEWKKSPKPR